MLSNLLLVCIIKTSIAMKPHQRLDAWKLSMEFVKRVYTVTRKFPDEEKFGLTSQLRRASVSVPANIAEGAARQSKKAFVQFLFISNGSISELDTLLVLSLDLGFITPSDFEELNTRLEAISKCNVGLIKSLQRSISS
jgi:four helix bundle protein